MKRFLFLLVSLLMIGCGGDDGPPPAPEAALLVFPLQNSECTTGQSINANLSQVTFEWQPAANTDLYTLSVVNLTTNVSQSIATVATSANLSIAKGTPFSWSVSSTNDKSSQTATSENWLFYNEGAQLSYAPFPAQILSPKAGATVLPDTMDRVELSWIGADVEDDIDRFEVYFSEQNPPENLLSSIGSGTMQTEVSVVSGTTYYWKVVTVDAQGNTSDSGVFDFKVL
ncbi:MAG: hypothetical protein ED555_02385 [Allomuricauda sp.]|nr:MAG: hypothetical protein ED555_02385 [Allomuricauda sp.]